MKYINGNEILPDKLIKELQNYAEGIYVYIPKKNSKKDKCREKTNYHREMELRNKHIYDKFLEGVGSTHCVTSQHTDVSIWLVLNSQTHVWLFYKAIRGSFFCPRATHSEAMKRHRIS